MRYKAIVFPASVDWKQTDVVISRRTRIPAYFVRRKRRDLGLPKAKWTRPDAAKKRVIKDPAKLDFNLRDRDLSRIHGVSRERIRQLRVEHAEGYQKPDRTRQKTVTHPRVALWAAAMKDLTVNGATFSALRVGEIYTRYQNVISFQYFNRLAKLLNLGLRTNYQNYGLYDFALPDLTLSQIWGVAFGTILAARRKAKIPPSDHGGRLRLAPWFKARVAIQESAAYRHKQRIAAQLQALSKDKSFLKEKPAKLTPRLVAIAKTLDNTKLYGKGLPDKMVDAFLAASPSQAEKVIFAYAHNLKLSS